MHQFKMFIICPDFAIIFYCKKRNYSILKWNYKSIFLKSYKLFCKCNPIILYKIQIIKIFESCLYLCKVIRRFTSASKFWFDNTAKCNIILRKYFCGSSCRIIPKVYDNICIYQNHIKLASRNSVTASESRWMFPANAKKACLSFGFVCLV